MAFALIAAQVAWRHGILDQSYFIQDDYIYQARAATQGLGWDYLMYNYDGQLMPFGFAVVWVITRLNPLSWDLASGVLLAFQACASLAVWHALRVLFGDRRIILVPLALYLLTPLTVPTLGWWAAALNNLPLQIAIAMAIAAHVRYLRRGHYGYAMQAAGWIAFGMASYIKGGIVPVILLALTAGYFHAGSWDAGVRAALRAHWRVWSLYGGLMLLQVAVYLMRWNAGTQTHLMGPKFVQSLSFAWKLVGETFSTYFVGGPWSWASGGVDYATAQPPVIEVVLALAVLCALVVGSVRYRRVAYRAWLILLGYVLLADLVPPLVGRMPIIGPVIGFETRYVADAAPLVAILVALAFLPLAGEREPYRRPLPDPPRVPAVTATAGVAGGALIVASVWSVHGYTEQLGDQRPKKFIDNARAALRHVPPGADIYPRQLPGFMMNGLFGARATSPDLLTPLAAPDDRAELSRRRPTRTPLVFDDTGHLRPAKVVGPHTGKPNPGHACWETTFGSVAIPMTQKIADKDWTVQLSYLAARPGRLVVRIGDGRAAVRVNRRLGRIFFPISGGGDHVTVTSTTPDAKICIGDMTVGYTDPAT